MIDITGYTRDELIRLREIIERAVESLDDGTAIEGATLFPEWENGKYYTAGSRIKYGGVLYKVLIDHDSQSDWTPDVSASMFARVLIPDPEVIPEWEQPESANPYMTGDKVTHNGKTWISVIDHNVFEPGVSGWDEVDAV